MPEHIHHTFLSTGAAKIIFPASFFFIVLLSAISQTSWAQPSAKGCHCFKNMIYKAEDKFAADDYILATSFNSLIARSFAIAKREVVMLKMKGGINQDDLLVGLKTAQVSGEELDLLLGQRAKGDSWQTILSTPARAAFVKQDEVLKSIQSGNHAKEAGQRVADAIISDFFNIPVEVVSSFRSTGLSEKEITLILILSARKQKNSRELAALYLQQGQSWSEIAFNLNIMPKAAGRLILNYGR